jgi:hypothetical protein
VNAKEQTVSNEVEEYLTAYNEADATATSLQQVARSIERVAHALRAGSKIACTEALPDYPSEAQIRRWLDELEQAKDRVRRLWDAVPDEMRRRLPQPSRVGRPKTEVSFADA